MGIKSSQSWLSSWYLHFAVFAVFFSFASPAAPLACPPWKWHRRVKHNTIEIAFYLTRYAARQRRIVKREAPKVSGRARPTAGEGKYLSQDFLHMLPKEYSKPCHKRLIVGFYKRKKNDPGSVVRQPQSSQQEAKLTKPELINWFPLYFTRI